MTATESPAQTPIRADAAFPLLASLSAAAGLSVALFLTLDTTAAARAVDALAFVAFTAGGIALAVVDAREQRIPDRLLFPLAIAIAAALVSSALFLGDPTRILWATLGGAGLFAAYFLLGIAGGIGFGDVKLGGLIGFYLTWYSPTAAIGATLLAYLLAAPHAFVGIRRQRNTGQRARIPFGPYLIAGGTTVAIVVILLQGS